MHLRLIDANSVGYAQHHANDIRHGPDGLQTQAVAGMLSHIRKNIQFEPDVVNVLLWDGRAHWRYDLLPTYKSGRHRTAEQREVRAHYERQRPWIRRALEAMPVIQLCAPDAEADDLAFGLSRQLAAQGHFVSLYTADTDWLQLVGQRVRWVNARKPSQVVELEGFGKACAFASPGAVGPVKALSGDDSDDIEGVPDIATKRASALLAQYGSLEAVLAAASDPFAFASEPKYYQRLALPEVQERVLLNERLVCLDKGPAIAGDSVEVSIGRFEELDLYEVFVDLELLRFQENFGQWERTLGNHHLNLGEVQSLQRAVKQLAGSWARPAH